MGRGARTFSTLQKRAPRREFTEFIEAAVDISMMGRYGQEV